MPGSDTPAPTSCDKQIEQALAAGRREWNKESSLREWVMTGQVAGAVCNASGIANSPTTLGKVFHTVGSVVIGGVVGGLAWLGWKAFKDVCCHPDKESPSK